MSRRLERARGLLARPGAWLDAAGGANDRAQTYALRLGPDRRGRISLSLDETEFRALARQPGLRSRSRGGWIARTHPPETAAGTAAAPPGRPGAIEGERDLAGPDGRLIRRRANLGESPIAWLARRKDVSGRPWLTPAEVAAGERLRADAEQARRGQGVTMRWDALPRAGGGGSAHPGPGDRALSAGRRMEQALAAAGPRFRPILNRICVRGDSLSLAETGLGLRRRQGKTLLKQGLQALAEHYRIG